MHVFAVTSITNHVIPTTRSNKTNKHKAKHRVNHAINQTLAFENSI